MLVILDRDGVINEDLPEGVQSLAQFRFLAGACEAIAALTKAGHICVIATNQSVIGKGLVTEEGLAAIHAQMLAAIETAGGRIARIYYAPEAPGTPSTRRKPAPGMLLEAMETYGSPPSETIMIADALRDLEAAQAAGIEAILVATGKGEKTRALLPASLAATRYARGLGEAVQLLLERQRKAE